MLKPLILALPMAAMCAPPAAAKKQNPPRPVAAVRPTAQSLAAAMQPAVGQVAESGFVIKSITAEREVLVFTMDGPAGWRADLSPQDIATALILGFCGPRPDFFAMGVPVRVDTLDAGKLIKGPVTSRCPAVPGPATVQ